MASFNRITLVGNLTRDPETRHIASGSSVAKFSLAITRKSKQGDEVMYVDVVAWEKLGEICQQYLKKGASVLIEGRLAIRSYDDKDGVKKKAVEVIATEMQMLGGKRDDAPKAATASKNPRDAHPLYDQGDDLNDDIPF